jgi:hypothetical protein
MTVGGRAVRLADRGSRAALGATRSKVDRQEPGGRHVLVNVPLFKESPDGDPSRFDGAMPGRPGETA